MTHKAFVSYLGEIAAKVTQTRNREPGPQKPELEFPEEIRSRVESLLRSIPELADVEGKTLRTISGSGSISFFRLAISVLERLSLGGKPGQIYNDLIDFVRREKITNYYLAGIGGISLPRKLRLTNQASIIAAEDIPPSWAREFVFRIDRFGRVVGDSHEALRPKAALRVFSDQQVLFSKKSSAPAKPILSMDDIRKLEQATLFCLTLASERAAPVFTAKTSWVDHPAQSYHGLSGGSGGTSPGELKPSRYDDFDADLVGKLFNKVNRLKEKDRELLFLAMERLRRSRLHAELINRAIDLGIALEIIFLHDLNNNQELRYRAAIRAAFLVGTDGKDRASYFKVAREAYDARSKAVHKGQFKGQKFVDVILAADALCRKAAIKLVENGGFPEDWESLIFAN